jgi:DNA-binding NarL/FixJ family response regulator
MRTVLIVDDHAEFRESAAALLTADGFAVVGDAADGAAGVAEAERLRPDVVLVDVQLPGLDGFETAERLAALKTPPQIVLISSRELGAYGRSAPPATVCGFLPKAELTGAAILCLLG